MALAVLFPLFYLITFVSIRKGWIANKGWIFLESLVALQCAFIGASYLTGLQERLLSTGSIELIDEHQRLALLFSLLWLLVLMLLPFAFATARRISIAAHLLSSLALTAQLVFAVQLGHLGGQIIFGT
jgi:hypothetical protein